MNKLEKLLLLANVFLYGFLTVFSYSYVDLNLTISQIPQVLSFVALMQQLGYYHRPTATGIYLLLVIFSVLFFALNLWLFYKSKVGLKYLTMSTVASTLILIFAYPFLSSDLFNYLFDAKIITSYHVSPYTHRPLDFPNDEWLRFMRWVHRYSPYGPLWLGMSVVPSVLGFGKFILTFLAFKIFISLFHLVNSYLVFKILKKIDREKALLGTAFYALNPLFLIEGIANAHNDVVLATAMLAAVYFLVYERKVLSYVTLLAGVAIKYISILTLPWQVLYQLIPKFRPGDKLEYTKWLVLANLATLAVFTYIYSSFRVTTPFVSGGATQVQFQPWYLFWTIPFIALIPRVALFTVAIALAFGASLRYLPYLYYGDWSQPGTITFMQTVTLLPAALVVIIQLVKRVLTKR